MTESLSIAGFLRQRLHYPASDALARLDRLASECIGRTQFLANLDKAQAAIEPWMPVFYLPAAATSVGVGLHLRPRDVQARRFAFCAAHGPGQFIEMALSLEQLIYLGLLEQEGYGNSSTMPESFASSVDKATEVFGRDFYQPGRHGKFHSGDEPLVMLEVFGGTPKAIHTLAVVADNPADKLALYKRGIALGTDSFAMYAGAARALLELGQRRDAAEHLARSLACYHHTAYFVDLDEYFEIGRPLMREFPQLFDEDTAWQLQETDPRRWAQRAGELFKAGEVERADKLLNDLCHGTGDYTSVVGAFRKTYEVLGWDWAKALCDLRS